MTTPLDPFGTGRVFEEFEYRLMYLRPHAYADERIIVGLISCNKNALEAKFLSSVGALQLMEHMFGESAVEQFHFAAAEVRRKMTCHQTLEAFTLPTDLLLFGETQEAFTQDREGLLTTILTSAASLMRGGTGKGVASVSPPFTPTELQRDLFEHVNRLDPFKGHRIFDRKFTTKTGEVVRLPILGDRIFGAPLSFAAKEQMMKAESYVAKFRWLDSQMEQKPRIYVLAPETRQGESEDSPGIRELRAIAQASDITVVISESTEGMASQVIRDETAEAA
jgi:hypothetical protein